MTLCKQLKCKCIVCGETVCICALMHIRIYVIYYVYIHANEGADTHEHTRTHTHTRTHAHTHTRIHAHTQTRARAWHEEFFLHVLNSCMFTLHHVHTIKARAHTRMHARTITVPNHHIIIHKVYNFCGYNKRQRHFVHDFKHCHPDNGS